MTNQYKNEIGHLIENFMFDHHSPEISDWKELIDAHPEHAGAIADAAFAHRGSANLEDVANEWPLNQGAFNNTISMVQNLVHQTPSPVLADVKRRVVAIQGPTVKKVAIELGIGPYPSLLSGILVVDKEFCNTKLSNKRLLRLLNKQYDGEIIILGKYNPSPEIKSKRLDQDDAESRLWVL